VATKLDDTDKRILKLNSLGLSLASIGKKLNIHQTTVKFRLKRMGLDPIDTRRAFMEDVYDALPGPTREWLISQIGPQISVKDFVKNLIAERYIESLSQGKNT